MTLHIDFESKSEVDLLKEGAYQYAKHPSTKLLCFCYAVDDGPVYDWRPGEPIPDVVRGYYERGEPRSIHAHNSAFERLISWYVLCPDYDLKEPPLTAFYCTAAQSAIRAYPRGLDDLGRCLGLKTQKDKRGKELIKLMCIPPFEWSKELEQEMVDYCNTDVVVERGAEACTAPMTDVEFHDFCVNERINDRGIKVDIELAVAAQSYAEDEVAELNGQLVKLTEGGVKTARSFKAIKDWIAPYAVKDDRIRKAMTKVVTDRRTRKEERKISCDKEARYNLLNLDDLAPKMIELIHLLDAAGRTSVSKFVAMQRMADEETHRVHGAFLYGGAGQTIRFSSKGLQLHNFTRDCAEDPEALKADIVGNYELEHPMDELASMLRPSLIAEKGHSFVVGDSAQIEARVLPWLVGWNESANELLQVFRDCDLDEDLPDVYQRAAAGIYQKAVEGIDDGERQIGKVAVLSMGYEGGWRAFMAMARGYRVAVTQQEAEKIKVKWRESNPWAPHFWKIVKEAAYLAVLLPGFEMSAGRLRYICPAAGEPLYCILPGGQTLSYPEARIDVVESKYGPKRELTAIKASWTPKADEKEWPRINLYGGLLVENATQATAASLLRYWMGELDGLDWPVVLHVHDEAGLEVLDDEVEEATETLADIMGTVPVWAPELPVASSIWAGKRYRK